MDNEFTESGSYGRGRRGGLEEFERKVGFAGFTEDEASILFGNVECENV